LYAYYEDGNLREKGEYNFGDQVNTAYSYAEDGKTVILTTEFLNGKEHGRKTFYTADGKLQLIRFYEYGRLVGYSYLNKEGKEIPMIEIKNETQKIVSYFDNGKKAKEMEIVNGDWVNEYKSYYYSGALCDQLFYKNDELDGKATTYYPNGKVKEEINYKSDERNGLSIKYYPNGQKEEEINYVNDTKCGEARYYGQDGKVSRIDVYFNGFIYGSK
jgi:uncharacterized protein